MALCNTFLNPDLLVEVATDASLAATQAARFGVISLMIAIPSIITVAIAPYKNGCV
jgi:hypothetical protein